MWRSNFNNKRKCFILIGIGVGKTSLLNIIFNEEERKIDYSSKSETKFPIIIIEKKIGIEYIYFYIIGSNLFDINCFDEDISQKKDIIKLKSN